MEHSHWLSLETHNTNPLIEEMANLYARAEEFTFNPDQARDEHGRWTGGGSVDLPYRTPGAKNKPNELSNTRQNSILKEKNMYPRLIDGKIYVPKRFEHNGIIGDGFVELKPGDENYEMIRDWCIKQTMDELKA